jgi:hypothetical protein
MGERQTPALISRVLESQRAAKLKAEERERVLRETPRVVDSIADLVRLVVPNPYLHTQVPDSDVNVTFTHTVGDESFQWWINSVNYPRKGERPSQFWIGMGNKESDTLTVSHTGMYRMGRKESFDEAGMKEVEELIEATGEGIKDGSVTYKVHDTKSVYVG